MKIRTTERTHLFTDKLFKELNLFSIQGLTLNSHKEFSAGIEAIQYDKGEKIDFLISFNELEIKAKYYLTNTLKIPLYFIAFQDNVFKIYEVKIDLVISFELIHNFNEIYFINWYASLKGQSQPKPLMEAAVRVKDSIFDTTLEKYGMAWGGNIDGFMFKNKSYACIIENIYTQKNPLETSGANPAVYFKLRGPNYNTWYPTVKLAKTLNIPFFLFTMEGNNNLERIGFSIIDKLDGNGIYYRNSDPNKNIIEGLMNIKKVILDNLNQDPPNFL
jgi:hypothetical protein